jgi:Putative phage holin Dp-1
MSQSSPSSVGGRSPLLSSSTYNVLKQVAQFGLPLLGALYYALGQIWHFPDVAQVMASVAAVNTILGVVLGYSTATYNASESKYAGIIQVGEEGLAQLVLHHNPEDLIRQAEGIFKLEPVPQTAPITPRTFES